MVMIYIDKANIFRDIFRDTLKTEKPSSSAPGPSMASSSALGTFNAVNDYSSLYNFVDNMLVSSK